jgi:hypothetical protein
MTETKNVLAQVRPKLESLVSELTAQGVHRSAVVYMLEKEIASLRDDIPEKPAVELAGPDPANEWPAT